MRLRDVVDELLNDDRLADARAPEQPDLAALHERRDEIDDLDARLEHLRLRLEIDEGRRPAVNRPALGVFGDRRTFIHRLADNVQNAAERGLADGNRDRLAGVHDLHAANDAVG